MNTILYISCSPRGSASICQSFAQVVLARLVQRHPAARIAHRYLVAAPPPFVDAGFCAAIMAPTGPHAAFEASEVLISELERADAVVIATPMNNYSVPASLSFEVFRLGNFGYPFYQPPSLFGPSSSGVGMSM